MNTLYFLNMVAGNVFKTQTSPSLPTKMYLGLSTTTPTVSGANISEPSTSYAYSRIELTDLTTPTNGVVTNSVRLDFPESTGKWNTITHWVIFNSATGGNALMYQELDPTRTIEQQTVVSVKIGELTLGFSECDC